MDEPTAVSTTKEAKLTVFAARPEEGVLLVEARSQPERGAIRRHGAGCYSQRARKYASSSVASGTTQSSQGAPSGGSPVGSLDGSSLGPSERSSDGLSGGSPDGILEGRRVLVIGASSGIGRALAIHATHFGATVALVARRLDLLDAAVVQCRPFSARAFRCDVADANDAIRTVGEAAAWMGGLDVVVYAAGTASLGRVSELTSSDWKQLMATNVVGAALVVGRALPALRRAENGTIAFLSSHTVGNPWPSLVAYAASKAALEELARGLRAEEPTVRVLSIKVGDTSTPFADNWDPVRFDEALTGWFEEGLMRYRIMVADEVAELVLRAVADRDGPDEMLVRGEEES